jgi:predicted transglutaminase-like cysteine proteinase
MSGCRRSAAIMLALLTLSAAGLARAQTPHNRLDELRTGRAVAGPAGWLNWCMADLARCGRARRTETLPATPALLALLERVQREVNGAIAPRPEPGGRDLWRDDAVAGDCEDYALAKRALLYAAGLPVGAVRLATAALPRGELHAVLAVETDRGTLVLDNLAPGVVAMSALDYAWLRVEGTQGSLAWQQLAGSALARSGASVAADRSASLEAAPSAQ